MKKTLTAVVLATVVGTANAHSPAPIYRPLTPAQSYQMGYNSGYNHGRDDHRDKVARTVVAGALIIGGALVLYEVLKPSEYNQGQVVLTRF